VAAVEAGSFAQAAVRLHLSRSAVGKSIARLEQRLGVRLFQRTTRSQRLTDNGALFYERCLRALEEIRSAESLLETGKQQVSGRLRVAMPVLFGRQCVAPLLITLAQEHPGLELEMSFSDRVVDLVEEGFDMAVRNGTLADSTVLAARKLGEHQMVLCAAPDYLMKKAIQKPLPIYVSIRPLTICRQAEFYPGSLRTTKESRKPLFSVHHSIWMIYRRSATQQ
jgi:DNA-binding transcriptional LysR family regulator